MNLNIFNIKDKLEYLEEVISLEHDEWANDYLDNRDERIKNKIAKVKKLLGDNDFCKLILLDGDKLVGFISLFAHDCDKYPNLTPWYATMYVKKEYRRLGYSKILNESILKEAKNRGFRCVYLKTNLNNYYEKFGAKYMGNINDIEKLYKIELN